MSLARAGLALACLIAPLAPAPAQIVTPPGKWVVDWGETRCGLIRTIQGDEPTILIVRPTLSTKSAELLVSRPGWQGDPLRGATKGEVVLGPSVQAFEASTGANHTDATKGQMVFLTGLANDFLTQFAASTSLSVRVSDRTIVDIPIPDAAKAVAALDACNADLLKGWGADPAILAALSRQPVPINGQDEWFSDYDYPLSALREGATGSVVVRYTVGVEGNVTTCEVIVSSKNDALDRQSCTSILKRAQFEPGLDAAGKPVAVNLVEAVTWRM